MSKDVLDKLSGWITALTVEELAQHTAECNSLLARYQEDQDQDAEAIAPAQSTTGGYYRQEMVNCGNEYCQKGCTDGAKPHGPYWYRYSYKKGGGYRRTYIGKHRPA